MVGIHLTTTNLAQKLKASTCAIFRRAKAAAAAKAEPRTPPPKVNCTYDWPSYSEAEAPVESKGFLSRFKLRPFLEKKDSGRPFLRSELASVGISNSSKLPGLCYIPH